MARVLSAWGIANHPNVADARRGEYFAKPNINQDSHPVSTGFFGSAKVAIRTKDIVSTNSAKEKTVQMMDLREATKTLNAYSTLIVSKARFCDRAPNPEVPEAKDVMEEMIAALKVETKEAMVISTLVLREITRHNEQFVIGFTDELTELIEALNRNHAATEEARKATLAHEEKSRINEPVENPLAKAIGEFQAKHGMN
jgi:6-phosphofructokinase